jgi:hypothetical protein
MSVHNDNPDKLREHRRERKIGRVTYRVSSVYLGETSLKESLENHAVRKVLDEINAGTKTIVNA